MKSKERCGYCDGPGGQETIKNQVLMPIGRRVEGIDWCIHRIVAALNAGGVRTVACCCGHRRIPVRIDLEDGRTLIIVDDPDQVVWQAGEQKKQPFTSS